jgi:hypothetical protein
MSQIDNPVHNIKSALDQMFDLVTMQLTKSKDALAGFSSTDTRDSKERKV